MSIRPLHLAYLVRHCLTLWCLIPPTTSNQCSELTRFGKKTADCQNKQLTQIPDDLERDIVVLKFMDNKLTYLGMDTFKRYPALQDIELIRNNIDNIAPDAFRGLHNLQSLDLEGNSLKTIPSTIFNKLSTLRKLNLKSNPIVYLTKDAFSELRSVESFNFQNCWLNRIEAETFKGLHNLNEINLVNNELTTLPQEMKQYLPPSLTILRLHRNPWNCDCSLRWLRRYVDAQDLAWSFITNIPVCAEPEILRDISWDKLTNLDKFSCAAQIVTATNVSTTIELEYKSNLTIECIVRGDPRPTIEWKKGDQFVNSQMITERTCVGEDGTLQTCSTVTFNGLRQIDEGDYRCIAWNNGGRSETTYKLWVKVPYNQATTTLIGLTSETLIGIGIGAVVLILLVAACIVWMVNRQDRQTRPTCKKAHNYSKQAHSNGNGQDGSNHSPTKPSGCYTQATGAEVEEELIRNTAPAHEVTVINPELVPIIKTAVDPSTTEIKPPAPQKTESSSTENHVKPAKNNDFKMKIFNTCPPDQERNHKDKSVTIIDPADSSDSHLLGHTNPKKETVVDMGVPDVVQRAEDKRISANHRPALHSPVSPPSVQISNHVTHITQSHKRAEENPYAKPSDMKPAASKHGHKERKKDTDTLDGREAASPARSLDADKKKVTTFSVDASPCKNPLCAKDAAPPGDGSWSRAQSPNKKPSTAGRGEVDLLPSGGKHIKNSQSLGGLHGLTAAHDTNCGSTSPLSSSSSGSRGDPLANANDRYKTLPNKPKVYIPLDDSRVPTATLGKQHRSKDDYSMRFTSGHSGAHIELPRPTKTATIAASPRQLPPTILRNSAAAGQEPQIYGFSPALPPDPIPAHVRAAKTLPNRAAPRSSPGTPSPPPQHRARRPTAESTSLDDLLSPPNFGHVDKPKSPRAHGKLPKPGDKDEYGTAV